MNLSEITTKWKIFLAEGAMFVARSQRGEYEEIRGANDSRIYVHDEEGQCLAVSTEYPWLYRRLEHLPFVVKKNACVLLFPADRLDEIAEAIKARKKPQISEAHREVLRKRMVLLQESGKFPSKSRQSEPKTDDLTAI